MSAERREIKKYGIMTSSEIKKIDCWQTGSRAGFPWSRANYSTSLGLLSELPNGNILPTTFKRLQLNKMLAAPRRLV